jgi:tetratricopeptide (TPR) repeat protein
LEQRGDTSRVLGFTTRQIADTLRAMDALLAQPSERSKPVALVICGIFLVGATLGIYSSTFHSEFVNIDDPGYVTENPNLVNGLSTDSIRWAFTTTKQANWHPVTWLSHLLDVQLFGLAPGTHHATSVAIHVINTLLLWCFLFYVTGAAWPSLLVSGLFALHPLHVESVAWVAERKDVLSTFFFLLTLLAYARYTKKRTTALYVVTLGMFALGLMSKPMLVTLPLVLLLIDYWPLRRLSSASLFSLVIEKVPLLLMSAVSSIITLYAQRAGGALVGLDSLRVARRIENATVALSTYIGRMLWPSRLSALYPYPVEVPSWKWLASLGVISAVSVLVLRERSRRPYLVVGWLWYLITLIPVIGIVQVGSQPTADRYTYIPLLGLFFIIAWGGEEIASASSLGRRTLAAGAIGVLLLLSLSARGQVAYWRDGVSLWTHAVAVNPDDAAAHNYLGDALARSGQDTSAIEQYRHALSLRPDLSDAHNNLGVALERVGRVDEAVHEYEAAIVANPQSAAAHNNLGATQARRGDFESAIKSFRITSQLKPELVSAYTNLGGALLQTGAVDGATTAFESALRIDINSADAHNGLGMVLARLGRGNEAAEHFNAALRRNPDLPDAHVNYGNLLLDQGQPEPALTHYKTALASRPKDLAALNGAGSAYLDLQQFDLAVAAFRAALKDAPSFADARYNLCRTLAAQGRDEEAIAECESAVTLRPDDADYRFDLAIVMLKSKHTSAGIEQLRIVVRMAPNHLAARRVLDEVSRSARQ